MNYAQHPFVHLLLASLMLVNNVMASNPVLAPLGFALELTHPSDVQTQLKGKATIETLGINRFSKGKMLKVAGKAFDIQGLKDVVFVFDAIDQLTAVSLTMDKSQFATIFAHLANKYTLVEKQVPFVGNKSARFSHPTGSVVMDAPHLDFTMRITYQTRAFEKAFQDTLEKDKARRQKKEKAAF